MSGANNGTKCSEGSRGYLLCVSHCFVFPRFFANDLNDKRNNLWDTVYSVVSLDKNNDTLWLKQIQIISNSFNRGIF